MDDDDRITYGMTVREAKKIMNEPVPVDIFEGLPFDLDYWAADVFTGLVARYHVAFRMDWKTAVDHAVVDIQFLQARWADLEKRRWEDAQRGDL